MIKNNTVFLFAEPEANIWLFVEKEQNTVVISFLWRTD